MFSAEDIPQLAWAEPAQAAIPRNLLRFWVYLAAGGEQLGDLDYAVLVQILALHQEPDFERLLADLPAGLPAGLPLRSSPAALKRSVARLRRMGLVFTQRLFHPPEAGLPPRRIGTRWDFRSLFYNLDLLGRAWEQGQQAQLESWQAAGEPEPRPVFTFPRDFRHEITLPKDLALDLLEGVFYPVAARWLAQARLGLVAAGPSDSVEAAVSRTPNWPPIAPLACGWGPTAALPAGPVSSQPAPSIYLKKEKGMDVPGAALPGPAASGPGSADLPVESGVERLVELFCASGEELNLARLNRLRLMAARCDPDARLAGASGTDWAADALRLGLGVARPGNMLNYADAVLSGWMAHGKPAPAMPHPAALRPADPRPARPRRSHPARAETHFVSENTGGTQKTGNPALDALQVFLEQIR